jgi:hypothetical protein
MGKYSSYSSKQNQPRKQPEVHPIWRGVGLMMILLIPFLSYISALVLLQENTKYRWVHLPADLIIAGKDPLLLIKVIITISIAFVLYAIFMLVTFSLSRLFSPPRYGPYDVPPVAYRGKKKVR